MTFAVRSPVNVVPRELFGLPILVFPIAEQWLPARVADAIDAPLLRFAIGSIEKLGLKRSPKGPLQSIEEDGRVPLIDVGTLDAIRDGRIKLRGDVASLAPRASPSGSRRSSALTRSFLRPASARTYARCCPARTAS